MSRERETDFVEMFDFIFLFLSKFIGAFQHVFGFFFRFLIDIVERGVLLPELIVLLNRFLPTFEFFLKRNKGSSIRGKEEEERRTSTDSRVCLDSSISC